MKTIFVLAALFFSGIAGFAQKPDREELKRMKLDFVKEELQLTENEESKFVPIYTEFNEKMEAIHDERRKMMHNFQKNSLNMSNEELTKLADNLVATEQKQSTLASEYHAKFKAVLPPLKVVLLYKAEHEFKKHLIHKMKQNCNMPPGEDE